MINKRPWLLNGTVATGSGSGKCATAQQGGDLGAGLACVLAPAAGLADIDEADRRHWRW